MGKHRAEDGSNPPRRTGSRRAAGSPDPDSRPPRVRTWLRDKRPVLGFVLLFAVLMGLFSVVTTLDFVNMKVLPVYMRANAKASAAILNLFGEGATARDTSVTSPRYSVNIKHGCDAVAPSGLFLAAVLAFPASMRSKLPGLILGTFVLAVVNLIRIVTLFYTGIYWPKWFEAVHVDVWQPIFILLSLTFWILWAVWATQSPPPKSQPTGKTGSQTDAAAQTD